MMTDTKSDKVFGLIFSLVFLGGCGTFIYMGAKGKFSGSSHKKINPRKSPETIYWGDSTYVISKYIDTVFKTPESDPPDPDE